MSIFDSQVSKREIIQTQIEHTRYTISPKEITSWATRISFAITVVDNICCQIFCDLLINSAFERIFNVMQLILVKLSGIFRGGSRICS